MDANRGEGQKENEREQILRGCVWRMDVPAVFAFGGWGSGGGAGGSGGPKCQSGVAGVGIFFRLGVGSAAIAIAEIKFFQKNICFS